MQVLNIGILLWESQRSSEGVQDESAVCFLKNEMARAMHTKDCVDSTFYILLSGAVTGDQRRPPFHSVVGMVGRPGTAIARVAFLFI